MAKLEDDLKIKVKVASPEIRAVATVMNSIVFKKIIHNNTLIGDGDKEPLGVAPEILSDISTAKSDINNLKIADLNLETRILNLSAKQSQTDTKITYINMDITNLKTDVSNLQTDVSTLKTDLSTANANIAQIDAKFADYLPLSGGTMTGVITFNMPATSAYTDIPIIKTYNAYGGIDTVLSLGTNGDGLPSSSILKARILTLSDRLNTKYIGRASNKVLQLFAEKIGNLTVPNETGTIARVEDIPTLLSQLTNDLGFATSAEVQALIAALPKYRVEKVSALPETGEELVLYLVPKDGSTNDVYDEYIWEDGSYELVGTTQVDLSGYVSQEEFSNTISGIATDFVQWVAFDGGTVGQVLTKTEDGFSWQDAQVGDVFPDLTGNYGKFLITDGQTVSWTDTLPRGLTILTPNTFGSPMFSLSAGGQYNWTFYVQQTGLELHYGGYQRNVLKFPTTGGTLATTQNIADIGGAGTTGQVLTKTADGFSWQDSQGGETVESIQVSELPTPNESIDGKILQYIGETGNYENGLFYQCRDTSLQIDPIAYTEYIVNPQIAVSRAYELCELTPMVGDKVILDTATHTSTHYCRIQIFRNGVRLKYYDDPITYPEINTEYGLSVPESSYYEIEFFISELPIGYAWVKKSVQTGYFGSTGITINYANKIAVDWNVVMTTAQFRWKDTSVGIGYNSVIRDNYATAIGADSSASYGGVAVGRGAKTEGGIQLGYGGSTSQNDFYVGFFNGNNYKMLDRLSGKIPMERLDNVIQAVSVLPETPTYKQIIIWGGDSTLKLGSMYQHNITEWSYEQYSSSSVLTLNSVDVNLFKNGAWFVGSGRYEITTYNGNTWYVSLDNGADTQLTTAQLAEYGLDITFTGTTTSYYYILFDITGTAGEWAEIGAGAEIGNINSVLDTINGEVV